MINTRKRVSLAAALVLVLVATGCAGPGAASPVSSTKTTLNIGTSYPPTPNLDPGNANGSSLWYLELAYEPLIKMASDGKLKPGLATSWRYVGDGNTTFELELRENVKFSDGSPLTADVVKANLDRFRGTAQLSTAAQLADVKDVTVVDERTIRMTLSKPNPSIAAVLSEFYGPGDMVSGKALADPAKLATQTVGAGPYMLDRSKTVEGDHYAFVRNPHYWNPDAARFRTVVVKILPNPNSALAALRTGQVDLVQGAPNTDKAAKAAGVRVISVPQTFVGLALADRAGAKLRALGDVRVRQALNYAIDRKKIAAGLVDTYGGPTPTEQIVLPGQSGYSEDTAYPHDPDKAKQLLREAGYPDGFTLPVVSFSGPSGTTPLLQVMANQLADVGVRLKISDTSDTNKYIQDMLSGRFPAYGIAFGTMPIHLMGPLLFLPNATPFNPFHSTDPKLESLYGQAAQADPDTKPGYDKQIIEQLVDQAWFVPVLFQPVSYYARQGVDGVAATPNRPTPNPLEWTFTG
ncbi:MAG TPA: ABC transporter substrate-binding protein [Actinophytocola sp.]|jgi:peptide/nickel transport system substrate-binding protein|uniref:ABC transporter substrate-binding protein n=1 Tax=Actinophytocola sp. TaxID=1872138 RepID=UPI002F92A12D